MRYFRINLSESELKNLQGALSNDNVGIGNETLNFISKGIENALSETPLFNTRVEAIKPIKMWCQTFGIRLLDISYYKDSKLYTAKEFEEIVPRNIQV